MFMFFGATLRDLLRPREKVFIHPSLVLLRPREEVFIHPSLVQR